MMSPLCEEGALCRVLWAWGVVVLVLVLFSFTYLRVLGANL